MNSRRKILLFFVLIIALATSAIMALGTNPKNCRTFSGPCTGFGSRQCVTAPESFTPDAAIIEQCCNGWHQYPWIEVCEGESAKKGCGFCFW